MIVRTLIVPTVPLRERTSKAFRRAHYGLLGVLVLVTAVIVTDMYDAQSLRDTKHRMYLNSEAVTFRHDWDEIQRTDVAEGAAHQLRGKIDEINRVRRANATSAGPLLRMIEAAVEPGVTLDHLTIAVQGSAIHVDLTGSTARVDSLGMTVQKLGQVGDAGGILVRGLREKDGLVSFAAQGVVRRFPEAPEPAPAATPRPQPSAPSEELP